MNYNQFPFIKISKELTLELTDDNLIIANTLKTLFGFSIMYGKKNNSGIEQIIPDELLSQKTESC
jgi:hypothetical protein